MLLFEASSEGKANILTKDALDKLWEIHGEILDLKVRKLFPWYESHQILMSLRCRRPRTLGRT